MRQLHFIYNKTKKEYLDPYDFGYGECLEDFCDSPVMTGLALLLANSNGEGEGDIYGYCVENIAGRWAGDKIVIQGDFASRKHQGYIHNIESYRNISQQTVAAIAPSVFYLEKKPGQEKLRVRCNQK